jgi:hypothetical protein
MQMMKEICDAFLFLVRLGMKISFREALEEEEASILSTELTNAMKPELSDFSSTFHKTMRGPIYVADLQISFIQKPT